MNQSQTAPRRIASLLASGTEILYALGLGERVVAVSHECDYPADATNKPRVTVSNVAAPTSGQIDAQVRTILADGQPLYGIDAATLAALAPDLIVTQAQCDVCAVKYEDVLALVREQPALRHTRVVALNPATLADIFGDILRVGDATGRREAARDCVAGLRRRVETVRSRTALLPAAERPRTACIEWIEPLMLAANWMPELVTWAGGVQPVEGGRHSKYNEWRAVLDYDPQVVIVMPCGFDLARAVAEAAALGKLVGWRDLAAVRANRVYAVDGNAWFNRSGPRIVDSLEILAGLLHPELVGLPPRESGGIAVWQALE
ncbi:MAG: cobalamin-binding protein [Planctomycetia bacterium]|nr:cobalamin-binding protein [Planctomycetia bacterium]